MIPKGWRLVISLHISRRNPATFIKNGELGLQLPWSDIDPNYPLWGLNYFYLGDSEACLQITLQLERSNYGSDLIFKIFDWWYNSMQVMAWYSDTWITRTVGGHQKSVSYEKFTWWDMLSSAVAMWPP